MTEVSPHVLDITIDTPDGPLRGRMAAPAGVMRLAEVAWGAMPMAEQIVGLALRRETREGRTITCRAGCGACCRQVVPISPPEAWLIADVIAGLKPERHAVIIERFRGAVQLLLERGFKERLLKKQETNEEVLELGRDYFRLGLACPFLENESCSIYPVRPSICREYLVTSPVERCSDPFKIPVRRVPVSVRLSQALSRLTAELLGGDPALIPLTLAPAWAAEHAEEGRREWDGRMLIERLFELMSRK